MEADPVVSTNILYFPWYGGYSDRVLNTEGTDIYRQNRIAQQIENANCETIHTHQRYFTRFFPLGVSH